MRDWVTYWFIITGAAAYGDASDLGRVAILTPPQVQASLEKYTIVDARSPEAFEQGHLPGSQNTEWEDWVQEKPGLWNLWFGSPSRWGKVLPPSPKLEKRLGKLGLTAKRPILVVGSPRGWGEEGRIAWNFLYWGAMEVVLLDGGFEAWAAAYPHRIEKGAAKPATPQKFDLQLRPARRIDTQALAQSLPSHQLFDVRTPAEWGGETVQGQERGGHLPGARFVPHRSLYTPSGEYLSKEALAKMLGEIGASPVAYCVGGVRSALLALLVEARLGRVVANYDGSVWAWSAQEELPLISGARIPPRH